MRVLLLCLGFGLGPGLVLGLGLVLGCGGATGTGASGTGGPAECRPADCGPRLGMPSQQCADGSTGGNTGRCIRFMDGNCGWEIRECPASPDSH